MCPGRWDHPRRQRPSPAHCPWLPGRRNAPGPPEVVAVARVTAGTKLVDVYLDNVGEALTSTTHDETLHRWPGGFAGQDLSKGGCKLVQAQATRARRRMRTDRGTGDHLFGQASTPDAPLTWPYFGASGQQGASPLTDPNEASAMVPLMQAFGASESEAVSVASAAESLTNESTSVVTSQIFRMQLVT